MTVLLAYSRNPEGDAALDAALAEALRRETDAVVVNVTPAAADAGAPFSEEQSLDAVSARFAAVDVPVSVRQLPAHPDAADTILEVAAELRPEVIVIGLRRRSRVGKFVLGSTTQQLLLEVDCPVLAVKAPTG